jgi:hypothetical protein
MKDKRTLIYDEKLQERALTVWDFIFPEEVREKGQQIVEDFKQSISKEVAEFIWNFIAVILELVYKGGYYIGYGFGEFETGIQAGKQEVLRERRIILPSLDEIIDLHLKGYLRDETAYDELSRTGVDWEHISALYYDLTRKATPETLANLTQRNIIDKQTYFELMQKLGYREDQAELILEAHRVLPNVNDLIYVVKKWGWTNEDILDIFKWLGLHGLTALVTLESYYKIPSIQDILRFMVREAFNPYAIEKYRMLDEFPEEAVRFAEIQGLTREWVEKYWIAHWELPSPMQVFDMYHRVDKEAGEDKEPITSPFRGETRYRVISKQVVNDYLKFADYLHYWRDKLLRISNNVLTRVDVRRMYELGIFNEDDVFFSYIEAGYSEEHAEALTKFTILDVATEEINKVRNELIEAYVDGAINKEQLREYLLQIIPNETIVGILVLYAEWRKVNDIRGKVLNSIKHRFIYGDLDEVGVQTELAKYEFSIEEINRYLDLWAEERLAKKRYLTKTEVINAYKKKLISYEEAVKRLVILNYSEKDAKLLLKIYE